MSCAFTLSEDLLYDAYWIEAPPSQLEGAGVYMGEDEGGEFQEG